MARNPCHPSSTAPAECLPEPLAWFAGMMDHCHDYAEAAKAQGRPIVGIMCEFTPREIILAAGAVPVCLCGGSADTIPAAEQFLPANLCPLIKSTFGYHVLGSKSVFELGGFDRGRNDLRRKKENVRADGRHQTDVCAGTAAKGRRCRRPGTLDGGGAQVQGLSGATVSDAHHRRKTPRGGPADEPRTRIAAATGRPDDARPRRRSRDGN
jgi:hypothetical protein